VRDRVLIFMVLSLSIFVGFQHYLIGSYETMNTRLQDALSECIGLEME